MESLKHKMSQYIGKWDSMQPQEIRKYTSDDRTGRTDSDDSYLRRYPTCLGTGLPLPDAFAANIVDLCAYMVQLAVAMSEVPRSHTVYMLVNERLGVIRPKLSQMNESEMMGLENENSFQSNLIPTGWFCISVEFR